MTAYRRIKKKILKAVERMNFNGQTYWCGYISGTRDAGLLTNRQVLKLGDILREGSFQWK